MSYYNDEQTSHLQSGIKISETAIYYLESIRKWTLFLSIMGFIGLGFIVLIGLSIGAILQEIPMASEMPVPPALFSVIYLIIALIHFFPVLYLLKFSIGLKRALNQRDEIALEGALESLKSHYKYIGIFMIVIMSIYALFFMIGMLAYGLS